jgi:hypothetical protein
MEQIEAPAEAASTPVISAMKTIAGGLLVAPTVALWTIYVFVVMGVLGAKAVIRRVRITTLRPIAG